MNPSAEKIAAAILAGGGSSRYGSIPKGLLEVAPGISIIDHEIRELAAAGLGEIVIVADDPELYGHCGPQIIPDLRPNIGPLGGLEAALAHHQTPDDATLILPCDLPGITAAELSYLQGAFVNSSAMVAVAVTGGFFWEPLCTVVHNALLPTVRQAIDAGERRPLLLWQAMGALGVHFDDATPFFNINTPQDMARWRAMRGGLDERHTGRSGSFAGAGWQLPERRGHSG